MTHYHPEKGYPSTHAQSATLSFTRHPQLVSLLPSEFLSSTLKYLVPSETLTIGCQLDRASSHQRQGPRHIWRRDFRFGWGGAIYPECKWYSFICWGRVERGGKRKKPVESQHSSLTGDALCVTRCLRLQLPWIPHHSGLTVQSVYEPNTPSLHYIVFFFLQILSFCSEKSN